MPDFLLEVGIEEVPVSDIPPILEQLEDLYKAHLEEAKIEFASIETAATNRRFMVHIARLSEKAADRQEQVLGPSKQIAYDEDGNPTVALNKFLAFHEMQPADLIEIENKKGIYLGLNKTIKGVETAEILTTTTVDILGMLVFSKTMVWNESRVPFIRPLKNLLVLFNNQLIDCRFAGVQSSKMITGHNLMSDEKIEINSFKEYIEKLNRNFVLVKEDERREKILSEIREIEEEVGARVQVSPEMLNYLVYNNEYPVVFTGEFDRTYLELPQEIISTFMINEKKLLPVANDQGELIQMFVGVSNIPDENRYVAAGNERVIRATFEDAKFFWDTDRDEDFTALRDQLKNVVFHKDLGSYYDKTERIAALAEFICRELDFKEISKKINQAAMVCKNDLLTRMVREFPSLQGIMGGLYLRESGAADDLWKSVYFHYQPKGFTDQKLEHRGAMILALADKLDNVVALLSKGIKTSSSKDPFGIRRDANGIIKIVLDLEFEMDLRGFLHKAVEILAPSRREKVTETVEQFFLNRIETIFRDFLEYRYDLVQAILDSRNERLNLTRLLKQVKALTQMVGTDPLMHLIILHKRLKNILREFDVYPLSEKLLKAEEERLLFEIFQESKGKIEQAIIDNDYLEACSEIVEMKPVIDRFFDNVLIMDKDEDLKRNRIALLQRLEEMLAKIADFSCIVEQ